LHRKKPFSHWGAETRLRESAPPPALGADVQHGGTFHGCSGTWMGACPVISAIGAERPKHGKEPAATDEICRAQDCQPRANARGPMGDPRPTPVLDAWGDAACRAGVAAAQRRCNGSHRGRRKDGGSLPHPGMTIAGAGSRHDRPGGSDRGSGRGTRRVPGDGEPRPGPHRGPATETLTARLCF
jgi:hypothetical protein